MGPKGPSLTNPAWWRRTRPTMTRWRKWPRGRRTLWRWRSWRFWGHRVRRLRRTFAAWWRGWRRRWSTRCRTPSPRSRETRWGRKTASRGTTSSTTRSSWKWLAVWPDGLTKFWPNLDKKLPKRLPKKLPKKLPIVNIGQNFVAPMCTPVL